MLHGSFQIAKRIGDVAYQLELSPKLSQVHNVFPIFALQKCQRNHNSIIDWTKFLLKEYASCEEELMVIIDIQIRNLRIRTIPLVKV